MLIAIGLTATLDSQAGSPLPFVVGQYVLSLNRCRALFHTILEAIPCVRCSTLDA